MFNLNDYTVKNEESIETAEKSQGGKTYTCIAIVIKTCITKVNYS